MTAPRTVRTTLAGAELTSTERACTVCGRYRLPAPRIIAAHDAAYHPAERYTYSSTTGTMMPPRERG